MRRPAYPTHSAAPPPPLPPTVRTVGQVVGETVKWYRENFFAGLSIGLGPALTGIGLSTLDGGWQFAFLLGVGGVLWALAMVAATILVRNIDVEPRRVIEAIVIGTLALGPASLLQWYYGPLRDVWLLLFLLVVPVVLVERRSGPRALVRSLRLAGAGPLHALGAIFTLDVLALLVSSVLFLLLRSQGDAVRSVAAFLSQLIISPVLFIGAAFLYDDQRGRLERPLTRKERAEARREHVATAPREVVPSRPGRAPQPPRPGGGKARPAPAASRRPARRPKPD